MPPDGKAAIREVFFSAEGLFRLMYPNAALLGSKEIDAHLKPTLEVLLSTDTTALRAAQKELRSFREWVEAAHFYRHEPGTEEPAQPQLSFTVLMVSQGAGFIRWLAEIDDESRKKA